MNERLWQQYWRRALWATWWLRLVPYVRLVGLNGSMATGTLKSNSDIDFYIVVANGHIFFTRIMTTALLHLLGIRRHGKKVAGRICLNRYASDTFLEITPHDTYHACVFHNLIPLFTFPGMYTRYKAANRWMYDFHYPVIRHHSIYTAGGLSRFIQACGEAVLIPISSLCERFWTNWQQKRAEYDAQTKKKGSVVILTPQELRFHTIKSK
jgi:hypothetical protein